jgi:hypothetical protein
MTRGRSRWASRRTNLQTPTPPLQIIVLSVLYILPVLPLALSTRVYRLVLTLCLASQGLQVR